MRLLKDFYKRDVLDVAQELVGKVLVRRFADGVEMRLRITETEAYRGEEDKACHAHKGRTPRTETMYMEAGIIYMYLIYGMYWMFNIVTGEVNIPQAVLIRCVKEHNGPGKLTRALQINKEFNREDVCTNEHLYIMDDGYKPNIIKKTRVGIDYAGEEWISKEWRFVDSNIFDADKV